jgi:PIN domain nuclease of toxin-antitoxin system
VRLLLAIAEKSGFELLDFSASDALVLRDLSFHHRDPFDRMLIAQAQGRDLFIATQDPTFALYASRLLR